MELDIGLGTQDNLKEDLQPRLAVPAGRQEGFCSDLQQAIEAHLKGQALRLPRVRVGAVHVDYGQGLLLSFPCAEEKRNPRPPKKESFSSLPSPHRMASTQWLSVE